jgi:uncharacterized protein (DUF1697 family)
VVLLRGVNVGRGNRLPMAGFRGLLEALGFAEVRTLLNSGNAIVNSRHRSAAGPARAIRAALQAEFKLDVPVIVLSAREFKDIVAQNPLALTAGDHSRHLVAFAQDSAVIQGLALLTAMVNPPERLFIGSRAAYLQCPGGILESRAAAALLGKYGRSVTTRNWATVLKLNGLLGAG